MGNKFTYYDEEAGEYKDGTFPPYVMEPDSPLPDRIPSCTDCPYWWNCSCRSEVNGRRDEVLRKQKRYIRRLKESKKKSSKRSSHKSPSNKDNLETYDYSRPKAPVDTIFIIMWCLLAVGFLLWLLRTAIIVG